MFGESFVSGARQSTIVSDCRGEPDGRCSVAAVAGSPTQSLSSWGEESPGFAEQGGR